MKSGQNYKYLVTRITGKDWEGDEFDRLLLCHHEEEVELYVEHLNCSDYKVKSVGRPHIQEVVHIDTPYDEEVNRTRELMYQYFMDRVDDIDGQYICEELGITTDTLREHLEYLLGEVK